MKKDVEYEYLRERNEILLGHIEEYMVENRDLQRKVRELQLHLSRLRHPSGEGK